MKRLCSLLFLVGFYEGFCNAQIVTGCDFFSDKYVVNYTYSETSLMGSNTVEVKYVYSGKVMIVGVGYKAYKKFITGQFPK